MTEPYRLEMFVPERDGTGADLPNVPFLIARLDPGWEYEEGWIRWVVEGVELLDGSFALYPMNQIEAVLNVIELALARKPGRINVSGSIITLSTTPLDPRHALFTMEIPERHVSAGIQNQAQRREVTAKVLSCARVVIDTTRSWIQHASASNPSPRPSSAPADLDADPWGGDVLVRLDRLERMWQALRDGPQKGQHRPRR